jgi:glycerol-3-phosphate dehydrogenase
MPDPYDVAIIGAGVVGTAIARELAHYRLRCLLLEAADDVGAGTSKANTALLHTGFDAKPGSLESRLVRRGHELLSSYAPSAGIPLERIGALLVAWDAEQDAALPAIAEAAARNGYRATRLVSCDELQRLEPRLARGAVRALEIPDESIICTFTTPLAFATEALVNGIDLALSSPVEAIERLPDTYHRLVTRWATYECRHLVNAAGLAADGIDRLAGHATFTVTPRRGELIVFDKLARSLIRHIILPVPTSVTKGVLVSPTVFGNVLLGPTAEDVHDRTATDSTAAGIEQLLVKGRRIVPELLDEEVTAIYAGLRAATECADYRITFYPGERYVCVGGIRSTGLSASMAIAEYVRDGLAEQGLALTPKDDFRTVRMANIGEAAPRPYQSAEAIARDPDYGRIVCHCERVTLGEVRDALHAPIPARTLDGLRRRTRALLGRCQGFYCAARLTRELAIASGREAESLLGLTPGGDARQRDEGEG